MNKYLFRNRIANKSNKHSEDAVNAESIQNNSRNSIGEKRRFSLGSVNEKPSKHKEIDHTHIYGEST